MDDGENYYRSPPKSPVPAAIIASIVTTVAVFFALRALDQRGAFSPGTKPSATLAFAPVPGTVPVEVPSLLGLRPEQARELLKGRDLLLAFSVERNSAEHAAGTIAGQSPLAASQVPKGSVVQAVLSRGMKQVPVPKFAGQKAEDAIKQLAASGLAAGPQKTVASDAVPAGIVVETEPPAGTVLAAKGTVTLIVSSGAAAKPVPKVTGLRLRAARELLEQQEFKVGKLRYGSDEDRSAGVVLDQKPAPPAMAASGTVVDLTVNED